MKWRCLLWTWSLDVESRLLRASRRASPDSTAESIRTRTGPQQVFRVSCLAAVGLGTACPEARAAYNKVCFQTSGADVSEVRQIHE
jgi:hypothetical protein